MERGQTSIEFIFIILIIVIYLFTVTTPMINSAKSAFSDIENVTKSNNEVLKIVNSISRVSSLGDETRETLFITLPNNSKITCHNEGNLELKVEINLEKINPTIASCPNNICDKNYPTESIQCFLQTIEGIEKIVVKKEAGIVTINEGS